MIVPYYDKEIISSKRAGILTLTNRHIISSKKRFGSRESIDTPFYYQIRKGKEINCIICSLDSKYKFDIKLSKKERKALYLMFTGHWYYDNVYTRFMVKYNFLIYMTGLAIVVIYNAYRLIETIANWK